MFRTLGLESFIIFLATRGQRLPGAAGVQTLDPQIPTLMALQSAMALPPSKIDVPDVLWSVLRHLTWN